MAELPTDTCRGSPAPRDRASAAARRVQVCRNIRVPSSPAFQPALSAMRSISFRIRPAWPLRRSRTMGTAATAPLEPRAEQCRPEDLGELRPERDDPPLVRVFSRRHELGRKITVCRSKLTSSAPSPAPQSAGPQSAGRSRASNTPNSAPIASPAGVSTRGKVRADSSSSAASGTSSHCASAWPRAGFSRNEPTGLNPGGRNSDSCAKR